MFEKLGRPLSVLSFSDDQPNEVIGSLIPQSVTRKNRQRRRTFRVRTLVGVVAPVVATLLLAVVAVSGYGLVARSNVASALTVSVLDPTTNQSVTIPYGPLATLAEKDFFAQTREAFIAEAVTFIEVDIDANTLRYFEGGVLAQTVEILASGAAGSWWDAPSGLYRIERKEKNDFSTVNQVYLPWNLTFEGNYMIHGIPVYPGGAPVTEAFVGGGIRLPSGAAEKLYESARVGIPVLVHKAVAEKADTFTYVPAAPSISADTFLVADIENGTVLAVSGGDTVAPIASITKLMTAVIAAEKLNLDTRVQVASPNFITSLIPRLSERTSVSMYSLLQLLLVESSNEAAEVIAGEYGKEAFVAAMNEKARQLGMFQTTFVDPSGLGAGNVSTPEDLLTLAQYIRENRQFIFAITEDTEIAAVGAGEFSGLQNFNEVETIDSFVGGKVGETSAAGQTVVSLHEISVRGTTRTVAIVLLGSRSRTADLETLLSYLQEEFTD